MTHIDNPVNIFPLQISIHTNKSKNAAAFASGWETVWVWDLAELEYYICEYAWSPIIWKDGHRRADNFINAGLVALDFDENYSLLNAYDDFCTYIHTIGLSKSHQLYKGDKPPCDRFRLVIPMTKVTELKEYLCCMKYMVHLHNADRACKDAGRFFWPCKSIHNNQHSGDVITYDETLMMEEAESQQSELHPLRQGRFLRWFHSNGVYGQSNRNITVFKVACALIRQGFDIDVIYSYVITKTDLELPQIKRTIQSAKENCDRQAKEAKAYNRGADRADDLGPG